MSRPYSQTDVFKAIADPTRRALLTEISTQEKSVSELLETVDMSMPALSGHLQVLREVGLVDQERRGRKRMYRLNAGPLREVAQWLQFFEQFWDEKLDALDDYLAEQSNEES